MSNSTSIFALLITTMQQSVSHFSISSLQQQWPLTTIFPLFCNFSIRSSILSSPFCCPNHKYHSTLYVCTTLSLCANRSSFHPYGLALPFTANLNLSLYLSSASFHRLTNVCACRCVCQRIKYSQRIDHCLTSTLLLLGNRLSPELDTGSILTPRFNFSVVHL